MNFDANLFHYGNNGFLVTVGVFLIAGGLSLWLAKHFDWY